MPPRRICGVIIDVANYTDALGYLAKCKSSLMWAAVACFAFVCLLPSARADTFAFSFSLDQAECQTLVGTVGGPTSCNLPFNGSGTFVTGPPTDYGPAGRGGLYDAITSIVGRLNGSSMTLVSSSFPNDVLSVGGGAPIIPSFLGTEIMFTALGDQWNISQQDFHPLFTLLTDSTANVTLPIDISISPAPEPSALVMLLTCLILGLILGCNRRIAKRCSLVRDSYSPSAVR